MKKESYHYLTLVAPLARLSHRTASSAMVPEALSVGVVLAPVVLGS